MCHWEENIGKQRGQPSKPLLSTSFVVNTLYYNYSASEDKTNMLYSYNQVDIKPRNYSVTSEEEVEKTEFVNFGGYNGASTETTFGVGKIPSGKFVAHMDTCKVFD